MKLSLLRRPLVMTALLGLTCVAQADEPRQLTPTVQKLIEQARSLARNEKLMRQPFDWKETDAPLKQVAARLQTQLGEKAPRVEVRTTSALDSTFALTQAPLGETLISLAKLSNAKLWVFADALVIAPESALTEDEQLAIKGKVGGDWMKSSSKSGSSAGWSGREVEERAALPVIGADVKEHLAAKGQTEPALPPPPPPPPPPPVDPPTQGAPVTGGPVRVGPMQGGPMMMMRRLPLWAPFELPFGELNPATQKLLQELVNGQYRATPNVAAPTISSEAIVGFNDTKKESLHLFVREPKTPEEQTQWQWWVNM